MKKKDNTRYEIAQAQLVSEKVERDAERQAREAERDEERKGRAEEPKHVCKMPEHQVALQRGGSGPCGV